MAYSGTTGQTKVNVDQLISYAYRDAGKVAEEITPEYIEAGKQALFYNLQNLSNLGVNLWLLENQLYGTLTQQQQLVLPATTIDVREARTNNRGVWATGQTYLYGDVVQASGNYYVSTSVLSTTSGSIAPTGTSLTSPVNTPP